MTKIADRILGRLDEIEGRLREIAAEETELAALHPELGLSGLLRTEMEIETIGRALHAPERIAELGAEREALAEERRRLQREYDKLPKSAKAED